MKELPQRKKIRLKGYDYSRAGYYFITFCVQGRHCLLGKVNVGSDDPGAPSLSFAPCVELTEYGNIVQKNILSIEQYYENVYVDNFVVMPNHVHLIIVVRNDDYGAPRSSLPTTALIPRIITSLKKYTNKEIGFNVWQRSYHDHIIRNDSDYKLIYEYINNNPALWEKDKFYISD